MNRDKLNKVMMDVEDHFGNDSNMTKAIKNCHLHMKAARAIADEVFDNPSSDDIGHIYENLFREEIAVITKEAIAQVKIQSIIPNIKTLMGTGTKLN